MKGCSCPDAYPEVAIIIAFPLIKGDIDPWIKGTNPVELKGKENMGLYGEPDPVLKVALDNLTSTINLDDGITHPHDEEEAKTTLRTLLKHHTPINADQVEWYLVRSNWIVSGAKEFSDLIRKSQVGKRFQGGGKTGLKRKYSYWVKESQNNN